MGEGVEKEVILVEDLLGVRQGTCLCTHAHICVCGVGWGGICVFCMLYVVCFGCVCCVCVCRHLELG